MYSVLTPESSKFAGESQDEVDSPRREGRNVEGVLVQLNSELKDAELSLAKSKEVMASAGELDVKATSAIDAENSDPAADSDARTMAIASDKKKERLGVVSFREASVLPSARWP